MWFTKFISHLIGFGVGGLLAVWLLDAPIDIVIVGTVLLSFISTKSYFEGYDAALSLKEDGSEDK